MVIANLLVVAMLILAIALVAVIFFFEVDWDSSDIWFFSTFGEDTATLSPFMATSSFV